MMPGWREELRRLMRLALPVMGAQVGGMLMGTVDTLMLGRFGVEALAAASIGNAWIFALILFGQGLIHGMDPLVTQAHGAGRSEDVALAAQRGAVLALLTSVPLCTLALFTEQALLLFGQSPALASAAHSYTLVQIPSIPLFMLFVTLRQYLQGREIVRPTLWITIVANLFNAAANYLLIFGLGAIPAMGVVGAGCATAMTRGFMLLSLFAWVRYFGLHVDAWVRPRWSALMPAEILRLFRIGLPVALQMSLEIWAFSAATLIAGRISPIDLAAHTIVLNMAALAFMAPLGISQGAVTRVGNLLGARRAQDAQRAAWVAFAAGGGVMTLSAAAFVLLRDWLPMLYTADTAVIATAASILPIAGAFQVFDGLQVVGSGILRGMGRTRPAAAFNLLAYWLIGLPLGAWLALAGGWGLPGLWWGLCLGLATVALSLLAWVRHRGPATNATQPGA